VSSYLPAIEAILLAAEEPVTLNQLVKIFDLEGQEEAAVKAGVKEAIDELVTACESEDRGIQVAQISGGYQFRTKSEYALLIQQLSAAKPPRLSTPAIESLSIIAYRQPITRAEVDQIRGVDSGGVLKTLMERQLVKIVGRKDEPGRPLLYATTPGFLELFGLKDLKELPPLADLEKKAEELLMQEREIIEGEGIDLEALDVNTELLETMDEEERETFTELDARLKDLKQSSKSVESTITPETPEEEAAQESEESSPQGE